MHKSTLILLAAWCAAAVASPARAQQHKLVYTEDGTFGYRDTPAQPWSRYRVHDPDRPKPKNVDPGTFSTQDRPGRAPSDAIILFDGKDLSKWKPNQWKVENGELIATAGRFETVDEFGSYQLHLEWQAPNPPVGDNIMDRGNNGVLLMGDFEIQIFDPTTKIYADGQAAAVYGQTPPSVTASHPPGQWEVYDILFTAPKFDGDKLAEPARVTICTTACSSSTTRKSMALPATRRYRDLIGRGEPPRRSRWVRIITRSASGTSGSARCRYRGGARNEFRAG